MNNKQYNPRKTFKELQQFQTKEEFITHLRSLPKLDEPPFEKVVKINVGGAIPPEDYQHWFKDCEDNCLETLEDVLLNNAEQLSTYFGW